MALGLPHGAGLRRDVEVRICAGPPDHELRAAAADVDYQRRLVAVAARTRRTQKRQARLLVAADRARLDAEPLAQGSAERFAVLAVAHGARGERGDRLGAVLVDQAAVLLEHVEHARD